MGTALRLIGIGWYVSVCMVGGIFAGVQLDHWLGFSPVFILLGVAVGLVSAGFGMYRMVTSILTPPEHLSDESDI